MVMLFVTLIFGYCIADICKPLQKLYCKVGWHCHMKDYIHEGFDGVSLALNVGYLRSNTTKEGDSLFTPFYAVDHIVKLLSTED